MRNLFWLAPFIIFTSLLIAACDGPAGPQGPPGPEILPTSFEFNAELLEQNDFEDCHDIPAQIDVYESDVFIAYVLEDYIEGEDLEIWRQLPITEFTDRGTRLFDFDYTFVDVCVFLDANYTLNSSDEFSLTLIRAVHIPADFLSFQLGGVIPDAGTYGELQDKLKIEIPVIGR